jgi:xylulokinase
VSKILSIDLGTTYFKLSLFDRSGRLLDIYRMPAPAVVPREGFLEISADDFCTAIQHGISELHQANNDSDDIEAVTFATQTNSFLLLDREQCPLTPIILWPDRRAESLDEEVRCHCDIPDFFSVAGFTRINFQCMAAKLLWLQKESPEIYRRTSKVSLISDYFTLLFTGRHITEAGAAGLTGLVDIRRCRWHSELLARYGIERDQLPEIVRAGTDLGPITPQAAQRFGLPEGCRFIVGCLDQYAGAIGAGNVESGIISETTGTVLATVRCDHRFDENVSDAVLQGPAYRDGLYWKMTFGEVSANYLERFRDQLPDCPDFEQLVSLADPIAPGAEGLQLNADARRGESAEIFANSTPRHTRGHRVRCIMETVAYALGEQMAILSDGGRPSEIRCAGGAARSKLWLQIKADVLGVPTIATECPEPTSLGAAMLAHATLSGVDLASIARLWTRLKPPHYPNPDRHRLYQSLRCKISN